MIRSPTSRFAGWQPLAGGAWLFAGEHFSDERGTSDEISDFAGWPGEAEPFVVAQENVVTTRWAGCARGLHYQIAPHAQAKLVTVVRGSAQFFWVPFDEETPVVHSISLTADAASLYTPPHCAHGMLALADDTQFLLKMSQPVSAAHRGEVGFMAKSLAIVFAHPLRDDLLSSRDRNAPEWSMRRRSVLR